MDEAVHVTRHKHRDYDDPPGKFERLAGRFGVPAAILVFVGVALWITAQWVATNVVAPGMQRHFQFLDRTEGMLKQTTETQQKIAASLDQLTDETHENGRKTEVTHELLQKQFKAFSDLAGKLEKQ